MFEELKNLTIDTTKEEFKDFPPFLNGNVFIEYDNGFVTIEPEQPLIIPQTISLRQARELLIRQGLFETVQNLIDNMEDPVEKLIIQNYWEYSTVFERDNAVVIQMSNRLGLTDKQLDELFIEASKL